MKGFDRTKYQNCTYVTPMMMKIYSKDKYVYGWVEVGGDPNHLDGYWAARVRAQKTGKLFRVYKIEDDFPEGYPRGKFSERGRVLTRSGAAKKVAVRLLELSEVISQELNLPLVYSAKEVRMYREEAESIALQNSRAGLF